MYRHSWVNNCNELKYDEDHLLSCLPNCGPLERWTMIRLLFFLLLKYLSVTQPVCVTLNCIITMWAMSQICMFTYDDVCRDTLTYLELIESFSTFIFHLLIFIYNLHNRKRYSVQYVCQQNCLIEKKNYAKLLISIQRAITQYQLKGVLWMFAK